MKLSIPLPVLDPRRRWAEVVEPIVEVTEARNALSHGLEPELLAQWSQARTRRALGRNRSFRANRKTVAAALSGFDWDLQRTAAHRDDASIRALLWNIERGKRFEPLTGILRDDPQLGRAGLYMFCEVDWGMGRSGNRHVARAIAEQLGLGYVFAPSHLVIAPGDVGELEHDEPNTTSLHGVALLSRYPVRRVCGVPLPEYIDKFKVVEKRLGWKRALVAEVELPVGPTTVAAVHLDPFAPPRHRARQMRMVLRAIERFGNRRVLLGGDLNTNTYDFGSAPGLAISLARKLFVLGFDRTIENYMTPERIYEKRMFKALRKAGLRTEGFTDTTKGTIYYDLNDPEVVAKSLEYITPKLLAWLQKRLERWNGCVPLRLDWFAGRGLEPIRSEVFERPNHNGARVADHNPMLVELGVGDR